MSSKASASLYLGNNSKIVLNIDILITKSVAIDSVQDKSKLQRYTKCLYERKNLIIEKFWRLSLNLSSYSAKHMTTN